jgi:hypothetical protein
MAGKVWTAQHARFRRAPLAGDSGHPHARMPKLGRFLNRQSYPAFAMPYKEI